MKRIVVIFTLLVACNTPQPNVNRAPIAAFTISSNPASVGTNLNFNASTSSDPDGDNLTYTWDFGDSTNGSGVTTTHAFSTAGSKTITLSVSDGKISSSTSRNLTISSPTVSSDWRRLDTGTSGANASFFQRLRVSSNARGDAVAIWEDYPAKLRVSLYKADTDAWSPVTTFEQSGSFLNGARVRVLPDGNAVLAWMDVPVSGAAMRWRFAKSNGLLWEVASDILTLEADVQGVIYSDLQVNNDGQIALAWQTSKVTFPSYSKSYVSILSGANWTTTKLGDDLAGPAKIALGNNGLLTVLYSSRTATSSSGFSVFSRQYNFSTGWASPQVLQTTNSQYTCLSNSSPCYAISAGQNGKTVALFWDAIGTFSGDGTITSKVLDANTNVWKAILEPIGSNTTFPILHSDALGNAIALYITRNQSNQGQLTSRRFDASTDTWTTVRTRDSLFATSAAMNASGEVLAYGETAGPKTVTNLAIEWSPLTAYDDYTNCIPRISDIGLDDNGMGLMVQICETPTVSSPMFIRAKRFSIR
jgi:hypothetical protein